MRLVPQNDVASPRGPRGPRGTDGPPAGATEAARASAETQGARPPQGDRPSRVLITAALLFAGFFAAWLPQLTRLPFYNSIENIVVQTALETRRGGEWLVPRMVDRPRTRKPPLAAWVSAAAMRRATVAALSDPAAREAAYVRLAREVRLPALIAACLTIVATFELGRLLGGGLSAGVAAALIAGTSLLFLEYARLATPDTYLTLFVTACNVMLARAIVRGQRWPGCCGAGLCLGLAVMSKGPVALVETVVPAAMYLAWRRPARADGQGEGGGDGLPAVNGSGRTWILPAAAGVALCLATVLPWAAVVTAQVPGVWRTWVQEVTRVDPADPQPEPWYHAFHVFRHFMPWTLWLVLGAIAAAMAAWRCRRHDGGEREPAELALWLLVVPVVVLALFSERKPRYLLPVIPAGAVLAGWALVHVMRGGVPRWRQRSDTITHYVLVSAMTLGIATLGAVRLRTADGEPWFTLPVAAALAGAGAGLAAGGWMLRRSGAPALLAATVAAMLVFDVAYTSGSSRSPDGRSDLKPLADAIARQAPPDAPVWSVYPGDPDRNAPLDLSIYLNRIVRPAASLEAALSAASTPAGERVIVVVGTPAGEPTPTISTAASTTHLGTARRGGIAWHAFAVRVSSAGGAG